MLNLSKSWRIYKNILYVLLLVFSLSPCKVKEVFLNVFEVHYQATSNKTRTTLPHFSNCNNTIGNENYATAKQIWLNKSIYKSEGKYSKLTISNAFLVKKIEDKNTLSFIQILAKRGPPKYILYQQLKVNLV